MIVTPLKIQHGMRRQINLWRETVAKQHHRLGWKIGFNMEADQHRLGLPSAMIGFLSNECCIASGESYTASIDSKLLVEPEVAILIGSDLPDCPTREEARAAIVSYSAALELVDTTRSVDDDIEEMLAGNLFHECVVLAEQQLPPADYDRDQLALSLRINNNEVCNLDQARVPEDFSNIIIAATNRLAAEGEHLKSGDWIITGAAAKPVAVRPGDKIHLDMGGLGEVGLTIV